VQLRDFEEQEKEDVTLLKNKKKRKDAVKKALNDFLSKGASTTM
jgi:hypothetical protein